MTTLDQKKKTQTNNEKATSGMQTKKSKTMAKPNITNNLDRFNNADIGSLLKIYEKYQRNGVLPGTTFAQEVVNDMGGKRQRDSQFVVKGMRGTNYNQRGFLLRYISTFTKWQLEIKNAAVADLQGGARFDGEAWDLARRRFRQDNAGPQPSMEVCGVKEPIENRIGKEPEDRPRKRPKRQAVFQIGAINIASSSDDSDSDSSPINSEESDGTTNDSPTESVSSWEPDCDCSVRIQAAKGSIPVQSKGRVKISYVRRRK